MGVTVSIAAPCHWQWPFPSPQRAVYSQAHCSKKNTCFPVHRLRNTVGWACLPIDVILYASPSTRKIGITAESAECSLIKKKNKGVSGKIKKKKFSEYGRSEGTLIIPSTLCKKETSPKERDEMAVTPARRNQQESVSGENEVRQQGILTVLW